MKKLTICLTALICAAVITIFAKSTKERADNLVMLNVEALSDGEDDTPTLNCYGWRYKCVIIHEGSGNYYYWQY